MKKLILLFGLVLLAGAVTMVIPMAWMISTSLKEEGAVFTYPLRWIPHPFAWENYVRVFQVEAGYVAGEETAVVNAINGRPAARYSKITRDMPSDSSGT